MQKDDDKDKCAHGKRVGLYICIPK